MTKEDFLKLGVAEALAETLAGASGKELEGFVPQTALDELNTELGQIKNTLKERDGQLEQLKTGTGDIETLKTTIATLQQDNKTKEETHAAELYQLKVDAALDKALVGAKNPLTVKPLLKLDKPVLGADGTIKGLSDQLKALMESEETKFLFNTDQPNQLKGFVPGEKQGSAFTITQDSLKSMTPEQVAENWAAVEQALQTN